MMRDTVETGPTNGESNSGPAQGLSSPSRRTLLWATGAGVGAALLGSSTASAQEDLPRLEIDGNLIVTENGEQVTLRGVSVIDPKRAAEERERNAPEMVDLLTDEDDGWHADVIRIPVQPIDVGNHPSGRPPDPIAFTEEELETYLETYLDPVVERCAEAGAYAIVDFHRHWTPLEWGDEETGEVNEELREEVVEFWDAVAPRYADDDHVLYEVYNEPTEPGMWDETGQDWVDDVWRLFLEFIQPPVDAIRKHTDTVTLVGSPSWYQSPEGALIEPVDGENLAYTYHIYPGHDASEERAWDGVAGSGQGVEGVYEEYPLFVTEFGWRDYDDDLLGGTTDEFGEPFVEWLESSDAIHWTAWVADTWWEPALFDDDWQLLGRDAGSTADAGEYVRRAIEQEGVPQDYEDAAVDSDGAADEDDGTDDGDADANGDGQDADGDSGDDSIPGFGLASAAAGIAGGAAYALRRRRTDER